MLCVFAAELPPDDKTHQRNATIGAKIPILNERAVS
jgi:hypothetical protein